MEELFNSKEYCMQELRNARSVFTNKELFNKKSAEALSKGLGLMYLYCPEEIQDLVLSQLNELSVRELYL